MSDNDDTTVTHVPAEERYVLTVGGEPVGFAAYTEIDPAQGGKGYGSVLVAGALEQVRDEGGLRVVPECPFVAKYMEKHHDFDDLIAAS
jgi:predicted GNAT family acetyltransferase